MNQKHKTQQKIYIKEKNEDFRSTTNVLREMVNIAFFKNIFAPWE